MRLGVWWNLATESTFFIILKNITYLTILIMSRNSIPFGYTAFGGVILVKLNAKISFEQGDQLKKKYPNIRHWDNGRFGTAIEGFIQSGQTESFIRDFSAMRLDAKIERLMEQKAALLDSFFIAENGANLDLL